MFWKKKKPDQLSETLKRLTKMRDDGVKELDVKVCTELVGVIMQEAAVLMSFVLHNDPAAKNFISLGFVDDVNPEHDFKVFLVKKDGKFPWFMCEENPYNCLKDRNEP